MTAQTHFNLALTCILTLALVAAVLFLRPVFAQSALAVITITTDGTTSSVDVTGGDVGYPGPSQVEVERDALGLVVRSTTRLFVRRRVYLAQVTK